MRNHSRTQHLVHNHCDRLRQPHLGVLGAAGLHRAQGQATQDLHDDGCHLHVPYDPLIFQDY